MIRMMLAFAMIAAASSARAEEFTKVEAGSVQYPLPPMPLPAAATSADQSKWQETEDSPALRVSRAWVKLGQAADIERSSATYRLHQAWKSEVAQSGPHSRAAQTAHAKFLAAYKHDLEQAKAIYESVLREVDAMDAENGSSSQAAEQQGAGSLAREAQDQIKMAERDERLSSSACFLSPETCQQSDPTDKALQDEISGLVKDTLENGGPDGGLSVYALRRKAGLLALRARVMAAVTQRAAARLATEVATANDGSGVPRSLPSPVAPVSPMARRASIQPSDPYR